MYILSQKCFKSVDAQTKVVDKGNICNSKKHPKF